MAERGGGPRRERPAAAACAAAYAAASRGSRLGLAARGCVHLRFRASRRPVIEFAVDYNKGFSPQILTAALEAAGAKDGADAAEHRPSQTGNPSGGGRGNAPPSK